MLSVVVVLDVVLDVVVYVDAVDLTIIAFYADDVTRKILRNW